jgi:hypothetical protein
MAKMISGALLCAALAALGGCYAPTVSDCTVSCTEEGDCASGQLCGSDGLCAASAVAGQCAAATLDAGPGGDARRDASTAIVLDVQITGKGNVIVAGRGTCSWRDPQHGQCTYNLSPGIAQRVDAVDVQDHQVFASWTSVACRGQGARCSFTPTADTALTVRFDRP